MTFKSLQLWTWEISKWELQNKFTAFIMYTRNKWSFYLFKCYYNLYFLYLLKNLSTSVCVGFALEGNYFNVNSLGYFNLSFLISYLIIYYFFGGRMKIRSPQRENVGSFGQHHVTTELISLISFFIWTEEQKKELQGKRKLGSLCQRHVTIELIWH